MWDSRSTPVRPSLSPRTQQLDVPASSPPAADLTGSSAWTLGQAAHGCHVNASPAAQGVFTGTAGHRHGVNMPTDKVCSATPGDKDLERVPASPGLGWRQRARPSSVVSAEASVRGPGLDISHSRAIR